MQVKFWLDQDDPTTRSSSTAVERAIELASKAGGSASVRRRRAGTSMIPWPAAAPAARHWTSTLLRRLSSRTSTLGQGAANAAWTLAMTIASPLVIGERRRANSAAARRRSKPSLRRRQSGVTGLKRRLKRRGKPLRLYPPAGGVQAASSLWSTRRTSISRLPPRIAA